MKHTKTRNSGIELLRIIIMLQIVFLHLYKYGEYSDIAENLGSIDFYMSRLIWCFCKCPINVFIIITGYFMVNKPIDLKTNYVRIPRLYIQIAFYSILIPLAFLFIKPQLPYNTETLLRSLFPIISRNWYFVTLYIIIMLLSPFINTLLNNINKSQYMVLLILGFILFSIWPNLTLLEPLNRIISLNKVIITEKGLSLYSFIFMYIIGAYIKIFTEPSENPKIKYLMSYILFSLTDFILYFLSDKTTGIYKPVFGQNDNPFIIMAGISLFMFFRGLNFKSSIVNAISTTTFAVYLIHEHPYFRKWLWTYLGVDDVNFYTDYYLIRLIIVVFLVFIICAVVDGLRQCLFLCCSKAWRFLVKFVSKQQSFEK
ncbi:MAG: acyltransferase [Oscillospiraceae bacterium]|nr:acyltransferase [Oscillospiraceae bacterium]MDD4414321.1 acyltransferase [Oscillospiraceae bacterium]